MYQQKKLDFLKPNYGNFFTEHFFQLVKPILPDVGISAPFHFVVTSFLQFLSLFSPFEHFAHLFPNLFNPSRTFLNNMVHLASLPGRSSTPIEEGRMKQHALIFSHSFLAALQTNFFSYLIFHVGKAPNLQGPILGFLNPVRFPRTDHLLVQFRVHSLNSFIYNIF